MFNDLSVFEKIKTQRNGYECGPIAIYNVHVLLGLKPPSLASLKRHLKTDRDGTTHRQMNKYLGKMEAKVTVYDSEFAVERRSAVFDLLEGAILLLGYHTANEGHYTTIICHLGNFYALNWNDDESIDVRSHKFMLRDSRVTFDWLRDKVMDERSEIYILRHKGDIND